MKKSLASGLIFLVCILGLNAQEQLKVKKYGAGIQYGWYGMPGFVLDMVAKTHPSIGGYHSRQPIRMTYGQNPWSIPSGVLA